MKDKSATIGLHDPQSPVNIGAALRAAGCYGAAEILYTGNRYDMAMKYSADTQNARSSVPLRKVECLLEAQPPGSKLVVVELVEGATPLPAFQHPEQAFYVFGPEDGNATKAMVKAADAVVYVPTKGCLNLAQTVNVVLYDRAAKSPDTVVGDALIRESQSQNNNLSLHRLRRHEARLRSEARNKRKLDGAHKDEGHLQGS